MNESIRFQSDLTLSYCDQSLLHRLLIRGDKHRLKCLYSRDKLASVSSG